MLFDQNDFEYVEMVSKDREKTAFDLIGEAQSQWIDRNWRGGVGTFSFVQHKIGTRIYKGEEPLSITYTFDTEDSPQEPRSKILTGHSNGIEFYDIFKKSTKQ